MNFKRARRGNRLASVVELTPLIDVVFLLLIFFMVSTTFAHSELKIALPSADGSLRQSAAAIDVQVSDAGAYAVAGRRLPDAGFDALLAALAAAAGAASPQVVVLADANATHQAVTRVLDAAGRLGLRDIRLATSGSLTASDRHLRESAPPLQGESDGDQP